MSDAVTCALLSLYALVLLPGAEQRMSDVQRAYYRLKRLAKRR